MSTHDENCGNGEDPKRPSPSPMARSRRVANRSFWARPPKLTQAIVREVLPF